tara:strand:+ start:13900 stop:14334 length:435 start_codon:yes stop_codon:yes gene_type:complete
MKEDYELDIGFSYDGDPTLTDEELGVQERGRKLIGLDIETIPGSLSLEQIKGSADYLPLRDRSVSSIFAGGVYGEYVDLEDSVKEADRVLKSGGRLFIRTWGKYIPRLKLLLRDKYWITELERGEYEEHYSDDEFYVKATKKGR